MKHLIARIADFFRESDKILLLLCLFATSYGCAAVFSTTYYKESLRPVIVQILAMILGIGAAVFVSAFDYEKFLEKWYVIGIAGLIPVI